MTQSTLLRCFFLCCLAQPSFAQITDNFSDGNLSANPTWVGETTEFTVNTAGELQLNAPAGGTSTLAVAGNIPDSAIWSLNFRMAFAASPTNLLRIYLLADRADLTQANGYFIEIGENGTTDALRFFRQNGATRTPLASGPASFAGTDPVNIRLRMKRTRTGAWECSAAQGTDALSAQFTATDATLGGGPDRFFGFHCVYTDTRKTAYFFDNISILPDLPDTAPPVLVSAIANDAQQVTLTFDEALSVPSAGNAANFSLNPAVAVASAAPVAGNPRAVRLQLGAALTNGQNYTVTARQMADAFGNTAGVQTTSFGYFVAAAAAEFDILINEIMADPSPSVGLPDAAEWIELYNRSAKIIDLQTLRLSDGGTPVVLPSFNLAPDSFVVLGTAASIAALGSLARRPLAVAGFPSLNNDGDPLSLTDAAGNVIDAVFYQSSWHADAGKREGGWSLERINPGTPCLDRENWQSCPVRPGGTPGRVNASLRRDPDTQIPRLLSAFPLSATSIRLTFSEGMDQSAAANAAAFRLSPARVVSTAALSNGNRAIINLTLSEPLQPKTVYAINMTGGAIKDCSGNVVPATDTVRIGLPETPAPRDIVINEILFNPPTRGSRYVEFYNRSDKIFNWQQFSIGNFFDDIDIETITANQLFLPGQYAVFTASPDDIKSRHKNIKTNQIYQQTLPSLGDDEGNLTLFWVQGGVSVTLDSFDYTETYHNALLSGSDRDGVALERLRFDSPTNQADNWTSASSRVTGSPGTPTLPNSQIPPPNRGAGVDDLIALSNTRISPDGDGFEDFLEINYQLPAPGYSATFTIYDAGGVPIKRLARAELAGTTGNLRWDGDLDDGSRARPGIHILWMEIFTPSGDIQQAKKTFAVTQRW